MYKTVKCRYILFKYKPLYSCLIFNYTTWHHVIKRDQSFLSIDVSRFYYEFINSFPDTCRKETNRNHIVIIQFIFHTELISMNSVHPLSLLYTTTGYILLYHVSRTFFKIECDKSSFYYTQDAFIVSLCARVKIGNLYIYTLIYI